MDWTSSPVLREGREVPDPAYIAGWGPVHFSGFGRPVHLCSVGRIVRNLNVVVGRPESTNEPNSFSRLSTAVEQRAVVVRRDCDGGFSLKTRFKTRFSSPEPAKPGRFLAVRALLRAFDN